MAATLQIGKRTPHSVTLAFEASTNAPTNFLRSGVAAADTQVLAQLSAGPLKAYLTRLQDWSGLAADPKIALRVIQPSQGFANLPVAAAVARGVAVTYSANGINFTATISAAETTIEFELTFKHSLSR